MEVFFIFLLLWGSFGLAFAANFPQYFSSNNPWHVFFAGPFIWVILLVLKLKGF